jgi:hypothetical protein
MKTTLLTLLMTIALAPASPAAAGEPAPAHYIDVHVFAPGEVTAEAVAAAHAKDLATETAYDVHFDRYWVDETQGLVYCLSEAPDADAVLQTHREAHGLMPEHVLRVTAGEAAALRGGQQLFLDIHRLGAGAVTAADVDSAHRKDLAVQGDYGVNFAQYWVDESAGVVFCLSEADSPDAIRAAHGRAHGLIPDEILAVTQGE